MIEILKTLGKYSPFLLPFISLYIKLDSLTLFLLLDFILINPLLKRLVYLLGFQTKRPACVNLLDPNCFGMPSGHTEIIWIFLTYLFLNLEKFNNKGYLIAFVILAILAVITMWQRIYTQRHTPLQVLGGILTGVFLGYLLVQFGY